MYRYVWPFLILSDTAAQLLMKQGAVKAAASGGIAKPFILCGYGFYLLSFVLWMQLLKETRLFIALSGASIVYITVALASFLVLSEPIGSKVMAGTAFISTGVFLIGIGRERQH